MKIYYDKDIYKLKITDGIFEKYLNLLNLDIEELNRSNARVLVLLVIKDFLDKKLKTDDLTYISTQMFYEVKKPPWYNHDNDLYKVLLESTEATWYKRKDEKRYKKNGGFLKKISSKKQKNHKRGIVRILIKF
jgi:hypothetical protein